MTTSLVRNAMQMMIMRKAYSAEHVMNRLDLNRVIEYIRGRGGVHKVHMMMMRKAYNAEHVMNRLDLNRVIEYIARGS